ncbi:MAG: polymer-forming cytoskeletal protein [Candidatus Solibacter usitatus]|nr:polymer-forming cytoskeletal protein [Candidatus Solibacter usitatus]
MSPITPRSMDNDGYGRTSQASIGKSVIVKGQICSREDLYFDGELEGTVELQENKLTIGPNGRVHANIKAREIIVIGSVNGNVEASEKLEIRKEARLVGDIRTTRIVIEDGAFYKGSIDIVKQDVSRTPQQPATAQVQRPQVAATAAAGLGSASTTMAGVPINNELKR